MNGDVGRGLELDLMKVKEIECGGLIIVMCMEWFMGIENVGKLVLRKIMTMV